MRDFATIPNIRKFLKDRIVGYYKKEPEKAKDGDRPGIFWVRAL